MKEKRVAGLAIVFILVAPLMSCVTVPDQRRSGDAPSAGQEETAALSVWRTFGVEPGHEPGRYESLAVMTDGAHLVIDAVVRAVKPGRVFDSGDDALRSTHVVLAIREVFMGEATTSDTVTMALGLSELDIDVAAHYGGLVGDEGVFFLIPTWAAQPEFEIGPYPPDRDLDIYRPVNSQGVFVRDEGTVRAALYLDDQGFPAQFEGMAFDQFEARVTAAVEEAS
jgi:hypothetical protein